MKDGRIQALIVEGSDGVRSLLATILESDPRIEVVGAVKSGRAAMAFLSQRPIDVVLMDIEMPDMEGFDATRRIMETRPAPIVCSVSSAAPETMTTFRAMEAGAVACIEKPRSRDQRDFDALANALRQTVKLMAEVKVVRRWPRPGNGPAEAALLAPKREANDIEVVGIGASTGGPPVLQSILSALPADFTVPVLIVQHIAVGFLSGLVDWLNQTTGLHVQVATHGIHPLPGRVYLAPDDCHMSVRPGGQIALGREEPVSGLRPAIANLFRSLADVHAHKAVGVLLTGMGKDGAEDLKRMRERGAVTIAQDRETCVVHGMPGEAIAIGAATHILPADRIAQALIALVNRRPILAGGR
jgi:two-component system chemotaxis response regulator CheB